MVDCERFSSAENAQQQRKTAKPDGIRGTVKCSPIVIVSTSMKRLFGIVWPAVRAMQCIPATNSTNPISIALNSIIFRPCLSILRTKFNLVGYITTKTLHKLQQLPGCRVVHCKCTLAQCFKNHQKSLILSFCSKNDTFWVQWLSNTVFYDSKLVVNNRR